MALAATPTAGPSHGGLTMAVNPAGAYDGSASNQYEENADHLRQLFSQNQLVSFSIAHIACSAGSSSGDNYMSVVKRVTISQAPDQDRDRDQEQARSEIGELSSYRLDARRHCTHLIDFLLDTLYLHCVAFKGSSLSRFVCKKNVISKQRTGTFELLKTKS